MSDFDPDPFLKHLTHRPGVYKMFDINEQVLYVGKARDLKKRVSSYFRPREQLDPKTRTMMGHMVRVEVTATHTEGEALLLESNLIKSLSPRYNIVLRDDKSYPYIYLSSHDDYPRLSLHRGARKGKGRYFGPFPSAGAVRASLNLLQKLFQVRQCEDSFFHNRSRPCLQHQIKRCTAPCVGLTSPDQYAEDIRHAVMFLEGRSDQVLRALGRRMDQASRDLEYEKAAHYRDQIAKLGKVREYQHISAEKGDLDVIAVALEGGGACVQVLYIREGRQLDTRQYFPVHTAGAEAGEVLRAFLAQYYLGGRQQRTIPAQLVLSQQIPDHEVVTQVLSNQAGHQVSIRYKVRSERARWLRMALENAQLALLQRLSGEGRQLSRIEALQSALELPEPPLHIECFDISHTRGESTVGSCVVFGPQGPRKSDYRKFNIHGIEPGDDYAAMNQALERRYTRLRREESRLPDLLLIDGGKGQISQACKVLEELQVNSVQIVGVAKGPGRKPGLESLFVPGRKEPVRLPADSPALHLIQQVRDEAHRFAITAHRNRRAKSRRTSRLEELPGIGPRRRQSLLKQLGGLQGVASAGVEDLARVDGISHQLAQSIYNAFHED